ncbi:hypothetical protein glysoja_046319 [Glycine soja]|uniref:Uncharacterized protein n=1 Tax=Glycine soja TaxID=3848 RepID=A0A0B2RSF9_GLYSO|nr:hypothetical protein glysoja_046319 [Glycine soja]
MKGSNIGLGRILLVEENMCDQSASHLYRSLSLTTLSSLSWTMTSLLTILVVLSLLTCGWRRVWGMTYKISLSAAASLANSDAFAMSLNTPMLNSDSVSPLVLGEPMDGGTGSSLGSCP